MWLFRVLIRIPLMAADALLSVKCLLGVNYFDVAFQGAAQNSMDAGWQQQSVTFWFRNFSVLKLFQFLGWYRIRYRKNLVSKKHGIEKSIGFGIGIFF